MRPAARGRRPRFSAPIRGRALVAAAPLLFAAFAVPVACGQGRDEARAAALEAGIASARASLDALQAAAPSSAAAAAPAFRGGDGSSFRPAAASAAVPPAAAARPASASGLVGAEPEALRRWFGEPDLRRPEGNAEVRLYLGPGCALDVVLYGGAAGARRVSHAAARADGAAPVTEADCLRGIAAAGGRGEGGGGGAGRGAAAGHSGGR